MRGGHVGNPRRNHGEVDRCRRDEGGDGDACSSATSDLSQSQRQEDESSLTEQGEEEDEEGKRTLDDEKGIHGNTKHGAGCHDPLGTDPVDGLSQRGRS